MLYLRLIFEFLRMLASSREHVGQVNIDWHVEDFKYSEKCFFLGGKDFTNLLGRSAICLLK